MCDHHDALDLRRKSPPDVLLIYSYSFYSVKSGRWDGPPPTFAGGLFKRACIQNGIEDFLNLLSPLIVQTAQHLV